MLAFILSPLGRGLAIALAVASAAAFAAWWIYDAGRDAARVEQLERAHGAIEDARRVEDRVRGADPGERERLRDKWTR